MEGLTKRYGSRDVLSGLSFSVEPGEVYCLLGPNGAGKTTTVEILEGLRRPDGGSARVLGLDPLGDAVALRPRVGVMLQEGGLAPGMRALETLELYAAFYPDADDPRSLLDRVGLAASARSTVRHLSGGQRQRLSLALALVGRPEVAFLDEPTAGMDPHARAATWDVVGDLRAAGKVVLLTTHAMDEAEALADRIGIVDGGRMVAEGTPAELRAGAASDEIRFSAPPGIDAVALAAALGVEPAAVAESRPGEYRITAEPTPERVAALTAWLAGEGLSLGDLQAGRRSLEEVFLRLTAESAGSAGSTTAGEEG